MTYGEEHNRAKAAVRRFVTALTDDEKTDLDEEEEEILAGVVAAAGAAVLGIWGELHRIADQLEQSNG